MLKRLGMNVASRNLDARACYCCCCCCSRSKTCRTRPARQTLCDQEETWRYADLANTRSHRRAAPAARSCCLLSRPHAPVPDPHVSIARERQVHGSMRCDAMRGAFAVPYSDRHVMSCSAVLRSSSSSCCCSPECGSHDPVWRLSTKFP